MSASTKGISFNRKSSAEEGQRGSRNSAVGIRAAVDKMYRSRFKSASMSDLAYDESDNSENQDGAASSDDGGEDDNHDHAATISDDARRLGKSAYQAMVDSEREGDMCIVEKSYIIIGTMLVDQSLFFCALQNLIDMERKVSMCNQN